MKKFGFTLVEVLMTLGIIGVVGMLVTPSIMENGRNETNAARLSTAVSNFENGLTTGMAADNAEDLYHWNTWRFSNAADAGPSINDANTFYGGVTRFLALSTHDNNGALYGTGVAFYPQNQEPKAKVENGEENVVNSAPLLGGQPFTTLLAKNGTAIFIYDAVNAMRNGENEAATRAAGRTLYSKAADVVIDVNGAAGPNLVGRDIFYFILSNEGSLFPYGSQEVHGYDAQIPLWGSIDNNAPANNGCTNGHIGNPTTCTARVVENGYRIDY